MGNENRPFLYSLRSKLVFTFVITILIPMTIATFYAVRSLESNTKREVSDKLRADLNTALYIYEKHAARVENLVHFTSMDNTVKVTLELNVKAQLKDYLFHLQRENDLDMLSVIDANGAVFATGMDLSHLDHALSNTSMVKRALEGKEVCGTELVSMRSSVSEYGDEEAGSYDDSETTDIMMIMAVSPIQIEMKIMGTVMAGIRINDNGQIVEEIKEKRGIEVSIFHGERVISTTFKTQQESDSLVKNLLLETKGEGQLQEKISFLNFHTDSEEYLAAYHPLNGIDDRQVGGIAVISSTKKMSSMMRSTANNMLMISAGGILLAMIFATFISYSISNPIHRTIKAMSRMEDGELPQTVKVKSNDEVSKLAKAFNEMVFSLERSKEEIEKWNKELEQRVNERTRELAESERKYRQLVEQSFYGIFIIQENSFKFVNEEFKRMSGYTMGELNNIISWDLVIPEHKERFKESVERKLQGEELPKPYEFKATKKDGTIISVEIQLKTIEYEGNTAVQGIVRDTTERKRLEKKQMELQEEILKKSKLSAIGLLVQGIAHNMNSPLTGIRGRAELMWMRVKRLRDNLLKLSCEREIKELNERLSEIDANIEDLDTIIGRVDELSGIIKNMTNKGRQEQDENLQLLNITELLRDELQFLEADSRFKHDIKKIYNFDESLPYIRGVYSDFSQSLVNIIHNAVDAMYYSPRKELTITTRHDTRNIYVDINDTGCGISKDDKQKIFDPFFTTKQSHGSNGPSGTGLGLHSAYTLLGKYRTNIRVQSKPGDTTFRIEIPYS